MRADALLFDFGGVIVDIDFERVFARWAEHAACDVAHIRARYSQDEAYKRHEVGAISGGEYFASLRRSLGIDLTDAQFVDGWNVLFIEEVPGISHVLAAAAQRFPLYVFSNSNRTHEAYWSQRYASVLGHFAHIFVSSTIGHRKPDAAAFEFVSRMIGTPPERIVFFDDVPENVDGARSCGLQAVHVTKPSDVEKAVAAALR